jgi:murein DD-endopeptidase MepM/ murein hydrolase activator NlpD
VEEDRGVTILIVPEGGGRTRSYRISRRRFAWFRATGIALTAILLVMATSWFFLLGQSRDATRLEAEVAQLLEREEQVAELAQALQEVEAAYDNLRSLFGPGASGGAGTLNLPPPSGPSATLRATSIAEGTEPVSWPLTERGFVTQVLVEAGGADHPGIDIAVPTGSYVRASGGGMVVQADEDPVYGHFLAIDHGDGYRSLYAHMSVVLVTVGQTVRQNEVMGLTGSSGRSTAPHLHFEILLDGEPIDPLTMVVQP